MKRFMALALGLTVALGSAAMAQTRINGGGATFPQPIYLRWVTEYSKAHPDVQINYGGGGSGAGITGLTRKTLDFAGSDAPLSKKEKEAAAAEVVHIPTVAGAVVLAYNLPDLKGELKLTGDVVADIYLGKVTKWNDPKLTSLNPGLNLPDLGITPAFRTDGSGTTYVFTNYLATQSEPFVNTLGAGKQVEFKTGVGGKGNPGVTEIVNKTNGAIGYIELTYASQNKIPFALMKNKDGNFVKASPEAVAAAGEGALKEMEKGSLAINIWNQPGKDAYPIAAFTYILVYKELSTNISDQAKAQALVDFLKWATTDGEKMAPEMDYAPLSSGVQKKCAEAISSLTFGGKPLK